MAKTSTSHLNDSPILRRAIRDSLMPLTDDREVQHVEAAAAALAEVLGSDRPLLQRAVYAIADPSSDESAPAFAEAGETLEAEWMVFRQKYDQGTANLLRLVVVQAVDHLVRTDTELAALVWYAGSISIERYPAHSVTPVWSDVVRAAGEQVEAEAARRWGLSGVEPEIGTIPNIKPSDPPLPTHLKKDWIGKRVANAAGITTYNDSSVESPNPHWPYQNNVNWSTEFTNRMTETLFEVVRQVQRLNGEANSKYADGLQNALNSYSKGVRDAVREVLHGVIDAQTVLDRRSRLLWWSRTLHSPSLETSYRELAPLLIPFVSALDLQRLVGNIAPLSAESLLREIVRTLTTEEASVAQTAEALAANEKVMAPLAATFTAALDEPLPLVRFLAARAANNPQRDFDLVGSTSDLGEGTAPGDLAVTIYRSAQAHVLAYHDA